MPDNFGDKKNTNGFDKHPENIGSGRPKGLKNRSTILRELLSLDSNEKKINDAIIKKAIKGDVRAYQEIQDTLYGKNIDKLETNDVIKYKNVSKQFPDKE